jgi:hypothetical protein
MRDRSYRPGRLPLILGIINFLGFVFALLSGEPWHATAHAAAAIPLAVWAHRSRLQPRVSSGETDRIDELETEVSELRRELGNAQERLDFAERLMAQRPPQPKS